MIERQTIGGKQATVAYLKADWSPAGRDDADLIKVSFDDGRMMFLKPQSSVRKYNPNHVASGPQGGQFTTGGGVHGGKGVHDKAIASVQSPGSHSLKELLDKHASAEAISKHPDIQKAMARMMAIPETHKTAAWGGDAKHPSQSYMDNRTFKVGGKWKGEVYEGGTEIKGYPAAIKVLTDKAESYAGPEGVIRGKTLFMVVGPPASGKSNLSEAMAKEFNASIVDSDDAKAVLPEYRGGIGANAVHEESSGLNKAVLSAQFSKENNVIVPLVGAKQDSISSLAADAVDKGYTVHIVNMKLNSDQAFRNMIGRFAKTGRLIAPAYSLWVNSKPDKTFNEVAQYDSNVTDAVEFEGNYRGKDPLKFTVGAETETGQRINAARERAVKK